MNFNTNQPIFVQIADFVNEKILKKELQTDQQIPSIRELATQLEVNPNTVMRAFERLLASEVVYNRRGMGYFVAEGAYEKILQQRKDRFREEVLPGIFSEMRLLDFSEDDILEAYRSFKKTI